MRETLRIMTIGEFNYSPMWLHDAVTKPVKSTRLTKRQMIAAIQAWDNPVAERMWRRLGLHRRG